MRYEVLREHDADTSLRMAILNEAGREFNRASLVEELSRDRGLQIRNFHDLTPATARLTGGMA